MKFFPVAFLVFLSLPAFAEERICQKIVLYQKSEGVEYKPDHEVPADMNPLNASPGVVHIPIELDLAERYGLDVPDDMRLQPVVSGVTIFPDGRIEYNGQDVTQKFTEICESDVQVNGQMQADAVKSAPDEKPSDLIEMRKGIEGEILQGQYPE